MTCSNCCCIQTKTWPKQLPQLLTAICGTCRNTWLPLHSLMRKRMSIRKRGDYTLSLQFFKILKLDEQFLEHNPSEWENLEQCKRSQDTCRSAKVVNDFAECSVHLVQQLLIEKILNKRWRAKTINSAGGRTPSPNLCSSSQRDSHHSS